MNRLLFGFLLAFIAITSFVQWRTALGFGHESWQLTEWLINYQGGFVRRGLSGEILLRISGWSGIQANHLAIGFSYLVYAAFSVAVFRVARRAFSPLILVSCFVLAFPASQDAIVRKDCFLLLCFLLGLRLLSIPERKPIALVAAIVLSVAAVFIHEAYVFFALPGLLVHGRSPVDANAKRFARDGLLVGGLVIAGLVVVSLNHGDVETARLVNDSWRPLWQATNPGCVTISEPAAAIQAIGWSPQKGISLGLDLLTSGFYQPMAWLALFSISFLLVLAFARQLDGEAEGHGRLAGILFVQLVAIGPLFLLGFDYGRWLFFWVASSIILHGNGSHPPLRILAIGKWIVERTSIQAAMAWIRPRAWILFFIGVPVCWNTREFLLASPALRLLNLAGMAW